MYRRCIHEEPKHAYGLYNLAVLLEEKLSKKSMDQKLMNPGEKVSPESDMFEVQDIVFDLIAERTERSQRSGYGTILPIYIGRCLRRSSS